MKLNFNPGAQNQIFHAYRINQSAAAKTGKAAGAQAQESRTDLAVISHQGRKGSLIETLMKQKMSITDQKNSLISSAKKDGRSMDSIKPQIEAYEKQLKEIDQQMTEVMAKEMEKQAEKSKKNDEPKTEQEIENQRLANVMDLSQGLEKAETVDSVKMRVDGEARVLKSEIKLDKMYKSSTEMAADVSDKEKKLAELEKKSAELLSDIGEIVAESAEKAKEQNETAASKEKEESGGDQMADFWENAIEKGTGPSGN